MGRIHLRLQVRPDRRLERKRLACRSQGEEATGTVALQSKEKASKLKASCTVLRRTARPIVIDNLHDRREWDFHDFAVCALNFHTGRG